MPKQKTNKSLAKRLKVTGTGKLMRHKAGHGHLRSRKSPKRLRGMRKSVEVSPAFRKMARRRLGI